jgi:hypothetical protein
MTLPITRHHTHPRWSVKTMQSKNPPAGQIPGFHRLRLEKYAESQDTRAFSEVPQ